MNRGLSKETAIVIEGTEGPGGRIIYDYLAKIFGAYDGDYFVLSETTLEDKNNHKRYRVLYVEGGDGKRYTYYFDITGWLITKV